MQSLLLLTALAIGRVSGALTLDLTSQASIKSVASQLAYETMLYYNGNYSGGIPGNQMSPAPPSPAQPYYWWMTGELFMHMIDYWYLTNDTTYNDVVTQGMLFQVGANYDYQPLNQSADLGNDDQVFWGFAAMTAAESGYTNPPSNQGSWLALAQAVFNTQVVRWDTSTCGGGLRWQILSFANGYNYKNSPSNLGLFNLAARLGAYTHNSTYTDWAAKIWDWEYSIGLLSNPDLHVYDGSDDTINCTQIDHDEWTYSAGMALHGAAVLYSVTNDSIWHDRVNTLWNTSKSVYFYNDTKIMTEIACEQNNPVNCDTDQLSFKSTYARFLGYAANYAPWIYDDIMTYLSATAMGALATCTGTAITNAGKNACGTRWYTGAWDNTAGAGQQMSALAVVQAHLIVNSTKVLTNGTGGTSQGNPSAGVSNSDPDVVLAAITMSDKAGAGILTAIIIILTLSVVWFTLSDESTHVPLRPRKA